MRQISEQQPSHILAHGMTFIAIYSFP